MITKIASLLLILVATTLGQQPAAPKKALLTYSHTGGHSPYKRIEVAIDQDGSSTVRLEYHSAPALDYQTTLSANELQALQTRILVSEFFSQASKKEQPQPPRPHAGITRLTITKAGATKTLEFSNVPKLEPLRNHLWRLCAQAEAITAYTSDGDIYRATGAVNAQLAGAKALQPERLREPMIAYVKKSTDRQRIGWTIEALAHILTAEELMGLIAEEWKKPDRRDLVPFGFSRLSPAHSEALGALYLGYVLENLALRKGLSSAEQNQFDGCLAALGDLRYEPAIPLLIKLFDQATQASIHPDVIPLAKMGVAGLREISPYLQSRSELQRRYAVELLQIAARGNPKSKYANPYQPHEFEPMVPLLKQAMETLATMQTADPAADIRQLAKAASAEISEELAR